MEGKFSGIKLHGPPRSFDGIFGPLKVGAVILERPLLGRHEQGTRTEDE